MQRGGSLEDELCPDEIGEWTFKDAWLAARRLSSFNAAITVPGNSGLGWREWVVEEDYRTPEPQVEGSPGCNSVAIRSNDVYHSDSTKSHIAKV
jgi:hypothetical protein